MICLHTTRLFDGDSFLGERFVVVEDGVIAAIQAMPPGGAVQSCDGILAPGFVDLQVNGGGGRLLNDDITPATIAHIADAHARAGTTTILPTLISGTSGQIRAALETGAAGLHLEGPFIALSRKGIHPASAIRAPDDEDLALLKAFPGRLLVTVAPEVVGADFIRALVDAGVVVFAGHTAATYEQAHDGLAAGVGGFTHLFNAMSQMESRAPNAVGAALQSEGAFAGIIADGHHVHPGSIRAAFAAMGRRLFLVSDAMATSASDATGFDLNGERIRLADGRLTNAAGTLAGAHLTMAEAVRNAVAFGLPLADVLHMATGGPATAARLRAGRVEVGTQADLVALDGALGVTGVWRAGARVG